MTDNNSEELLKEIVGKTIKSFEYQAGNNDWLNLQKIVFDDGTVLHLIPSDYGESVQIAVEKSTRRTKP